MPRRRLFIIIAGVILVAASLLVWWRLATRLETVSEPEKTAPTIAKQALPPPAKPFEFPAGGRTLLPGYQLVAIYGSPNEPVLGLLGQQDTAAAVTRVKALADEYKPLINKPIYPTFEIITTIASGSPTDNGDYSRELEIGQLQPWIDVARSNGVYVILDLQPGRTDFLTQAKEYEPLLAQPNVGLALDPEWRLGPDQLHLQQIGHVSIEEVNAVANWLADLTKQHNLPQKAFVLHEFRQDMITNRELLDTSHPNELAYVIHVDGLGTQSAKANTWNVLQQNAPAGVHWGWKNFTQQDKPMLTPTETAAIQPQPELISYQ